MRWPWQRQASAEQLVVSWCDQTLAYVLAKPRADGALEVLKFGVERQGSDSMDVFVSRLQAVGLKGLPAQVMLRPEQYQLLQIEAPAVPPEELRAAARYQIREMVDVHIDDVTLDVMRVGDDQQKGKGFLFVVAATNAVVRGVLDFGNAMHWTVSVIDIQETAQRNIQSALAARDASADHANAALVLVDRQQALLTISANEELFYARHFALPEDFLGASTGSGNAASAAAFADVAPAIPLEPTEDYILDYSANANAGLAAAPPVGVIDDDKAQRLLVEVQRSLDVWDRSWSSMPLQVLRVYAGERSAELAQWLAAQLGQTVVPLDVGALFAGFEGGSAGDRALCMPLLGTLMRSESRKL